MNLLKLGNITQLLHEFISCDDEFSKPNSMNYNCNFSKFPLLFQVWFQNRRMKDKRNRIAASWPYAALCSDPAFAATLLQAAASSLPLHYIQPPPVYSQYPQRYNPYSIRLHPSVPMQNPAYNFNPSLGVPSLPASVPVPPVPQNFGFNFGSDYPLFRPQRISPTGSPVNSDLSATPPLHDNLLMAAKISPPHSLSPPVIVPSPDNRSPPQTTFEKPKLFQPYKTEI